MFAPLKSPEPKADADADANANADDADDAIPPPKPSVPPTADCWPNPPIVVLAPNADAGAWAPDNVLVFPANSVDVEEVVEPKPPEPEPKPPPKPLPAEAEPKPPLPPTARPNEGWAPPAAWATVADVPNDMAGAGAAPPAPPPKGLGTPEDAVIDDDGAPKPPPGC